MMRVVSKDQEIYYTPGMTPAPYGGFALLGLRLGQRLLPGLPHHRYHRLGRNARVLADR